MKEVALDVGKEFCAECSMALRRFLGHMEGVESVEVEGGKVVVSFDDGKVAETEVFKISRESIEKLGYKLKGD